MMIMIQPKMNFTRSIRKIILTQDVENLGFKGEICFVRPGRAFNQLVPRKQALFYSDPAAEEFQNNIVVKELQVK